MPDVIMSTVAFSRALPSGGYLSSMRCMTASLVRVGATCSMDSRPFKVRIALTSFFFEDLSVQYVRDLLKLLFDTYAFYVDRPSRQAVLRCLKAVFASDHAEDYMVNFIKALRNEASKSSLASTSALVLTEWCSFLNQQFASKPDLWKIWGIDVALANAHALETCLSSETRHSIKRSALTVSRRGLRRLFNSAALGSRAVGDVVKALTSKSSSSNAKNAVMLGVVAGVSARLPHMKPLLAEYRKDFYDFYVRELIGSKTIIAHHIATGLDDFFSAFVTLPDLCDYILPAIEKALLRAPEIVLNGIISQMVNAMPSDVDLSRPLYDRLLKPLMANIKSTNTAVRDGVRSTFEAFASRSHDVATLQKIAEEILQPMKQLKVSTPEQKMIHAQLLSALHGSSELAAKIPEGLAPVALKEANDSALSAELSAVAKHIQCGLSSQVWPSAAVVEAFERGLADKRVSARRLWALQAGEILIHLTQEQLHQAQALHFARAAVRKMHDAWSEIIANPISAAQSGLLVIAYIFTSMIEAKLKSTGDESILSVIRKAEITKHTLVNEPKPSFLLNYRVYTKLTYQEDILWGIRALVAFAGSVCGNETSTGVKAAWMQAFLYFMTASGISPRVRSQAGRQFATVYADHPREIGRIAIDGVWLWYRAVEMNEKDNAASSAKSGTSGISTVLKSICLAPEELSMRGKTINQEDLQNQLVSMLVLCRPEIVPQVSWIELCLKCGVDPGKLAESKSTQCLDQIIQATSVWL